MEVEEGSYAEEGRQKEQLDEDSDPAQLQSTNIVAFFRGLETLTHEFMSGLHVVRVAFSVGVGIRNESSCLLPSAFLVKINNPR